MNMNEVVTNVTLSKVCSVSPDNESKKEGITKQITVKVKFDGSTIQSIFDKAMSSTVISWQNGVGRKSFDQLKAGQVVEIQFNAPASRSAVDPETFMVAKLAAMTPAEQAKYLQELTAKATK